MLLFFFSSSGSIIRLKKECAAVYGTIWERLRRRGWIYVENVYLSQVLEHKSS